MIQHDSTRKRLLGLAELQAVIALGKYDIFSPHLQGMLELETYTRLKDVIQLDDTTEDSLLLEAVRALPVDAVIAFVRFTPQNAIDAPGHPIPPKGGVVLATLHENVGYTVQYIVAYGKLFQVNANGVFESQKM